MSTGLVDATRNSSRSEPSIVSIHLLGSMRAAGSFGQNILPRGRKSRAILAVLCIAEGRAVSRSRLAGLLWDRVGEQQARASLRQALFELSSSFEPTDGDLITILRDEVRLDVSRCWVDALAAVRPPQGSPDNVEDSLENSNTLTARLLDDFDGISTSFDHWLAGERSRFESAVRERREGELRTAIASGDTEGCVTASRRLLAFDPTHEHAWQTLIRALAAQGDRAQALREYDRCRETLRRLLDIEPCSLTRTIGEALRTQRSGAISADVPTVRGLELPSHPDHEYGEAAPGSPIGNRVRVGVLPFATVGSDADSVTVLFLAQEIAAALARFRWFDVISPVSLPGVQGSLDWRRALDEVGLDYAVDGTMRISNGRLFVSVVLLDVRDLARTIWNGRFDAEVESRDGIEQDITSLLVAQVEPVLLTVEGARRGAEIAALGSGIRQSPASLVLSAIPRLYSMERKTYDQAGHLLSRAIELGPDDAMAHAWSAFWHVFHVGQGWSASPGHSLREAERLCLRATRLDPENAQAFGIRAHICSFLHKDFDSALSLFERSLRLNPNLAFVWALSAPTFCYVGQPAQAIERLGRYKRLAPLDPYFPLFETIYTMAYTFAGDYKQAAIVGRRSVRANPDFTNGYKPLLAALGHLGLSEEAEIYRSRLLELEPNFSLESFAATYPFLRAEDRDRYIEGLRKAGIPEH